MSNKLSDEQVEIIEEFISEVRDLVEGMESDIISLAAIYQNNESQTSPDNLQKLHTIFRSFHSIKGGSAFLQFNNLVTCAHSAENLLDRLRNDELSLLPGHIDLLCQTCDFITTAVEQIETSLNDEGLGTQAETIHDKFERAIAGTPEPEESPSASEADEGLTIDLDLNPAQLINPDTLHHFLTESKELIQIRHCLS